MLHYRKCYLSATFDHLYLGDFQIKVIILYVIVI